MPRTSVYRFSSMPDDRRRRLVIEAIVEMVSKNIGRSMVVTTAKVCRYLFGTSDDLPGRVRQTVAMVLIDLQRRNVITLYEPPRRRKGRRYLVMKSMLPALIREAYGRPVEPGNTVLTPWL